VAVVVLALVEGEARDDPVEDADEAVGIRRLRAGDRWEVLRQVGVT